MNKSAFVAVFLGVISCASAMADSYKDPVAGVYVPTGISPGDARPSCGYPLGLPVNFEVVVKRENGHLIGTATVCATNAPCTQWSTYTLFDMFPEDEADQSNGFKRGASCFSEKVQKTGFRGNAADTWKTWTQVRRSKEDRYCNGKSFDHWRIEERLRWISSSEGAFWGTGAGPGVYISHEQLWYGEGEDSPLSNWGCFLKKVSLHTALPGGTSATSSQGR